MSNCPSCSQDEYVANRLSAWETANSAIRAKKWNQGVAEGVSTEPFAEDVLGLAKFLVGDGGE